MNVIINGKTHRLDDLPQVSYERLCLEAGKSPTAINTVTYSLPDGRDGSVAPGESAPLVAGAIYNVANTGNA